MNPQNPHPPEELGAMLDHAQALWPLMKDGETMVLSFPVSAIADASGNIPVGKIIIFRPCNLLVLNAKTVPASQLAPKGEGK